MLRPVYAYPAAAVVNLLAMVYVMRPAGHLSSCQSFSRDLRFVAGCSSRSAPRMRRW